MPIMFVLAQCDPTLMWMIHTICCIYFVHDFNSKLNILQVMLNMYRQSYIIPDSCSDQNILIINFGLFSPLQTWCLMIKCKYINVMYIDLYHKICNLLQLQVKGSFTLNDGNDKVDFLLATISLQVFIRSRFSDGSGNGNFSLFCSR